MSGEGVNDQPRRAVKGPSSCEMGFGVVGLLMGGGVRAALFRPGDSCHLMRKTPGSLQCYRFWPWAIAGRGKKNSDNHEGDSQRSERERSKAL